MKTLLAFLKVTWTELGYQIVLEINSEILYKKLDQGIFWAIFKFQQNQVEKNFLINFEIKESQNEADSSILPQFNKYT